MKKVFVLWVVGFSLGFSANGQSFQNLGFESATIVPISGGSFGSEVQWNPAMPGWTGYLGANPVNWIHHNNACLSPCTAMFIYDQPGPLWRGPLVGNYSVALSAGPYTSGPYQASIAQTGLIPSDARSVHFFGLFNGSSQIIPAADQLIVSVGGQSLPIYSFVPEGRDYRDFAVDVSAFAGQTAELRFTVVTEAAPPGQQGRGSHLMLDFISFSATPVPEPAVGVFLLVGTCVLGWRKLRKS
jgi:hypothetical protein